MTMLGQLSESIRKALLVAVPVMALAACSGDDGANGQDGAAGPAGTDGAAGTPGADGANGANGSDGSDGVDGVSAAINASGVVLDGPVMGGNIYVFTAETVDAAIVAADAATDRAASLAAASPIATVSRNVADGQFFQIDIPAQYAGEPLFFVFDSTGAQDMTFLDEPFDMESVVMASGAGSNQRVNITPQSTMIAQLVRNSLDPDTDGTIITDAEIATLISSLADNIVDASDDLPEGSDPISGLDTELLTTAATAVGQAVRDADDLLGLSREATLFAIAADAADGTIDGVAPASVTLTDAQAAAVALVEDVEEVIDAGITDTDSDTPIRSPFHTAERHLQLASGLSAEFLTREAGQHADQFALYPLDNPTHQIWCIENRAEIIDTETGKLNPGVQRISIADGTVETIIRGMARCDGLRTTPWGTILATEETGDGAAYEILDPLTTTNLSITERGAAGEAATIVDANGAATDLAVKRTALPTMAWEGLFVLANGVVVGGDELRPGSYELILDNNGTDVSFGSVTDGGAIFKFIPSELHDGSAITALSESPLVEGSTYAMQVKCSSTQFGHGCEIGEAAWVEVTAANARVDANIAGATGYYRPEDMHLDPDYSDADNPAAVRFCWANTGNRGAQNWGEVICGIDSDPAEEDGDITDHDVMVYRFIEGDEELNAPDNLAFQPGTGRLYVIEDNGHGDIWACLPDGPDQGLTSDGCVRMISLNDTSAEPSGFGFNDEGTIAWVSIQHSSDDAFELVDDFRTDDIVTITGFAAPTAEADNRTTLAGASSTDLYGFGAPLTASNTNVVDREANIEGMIGVDTSPVNGFGNGEDASGYLALADGLTATFLTRTASEWWDQHDLYPLTNPTHLIGCIEESRGIVDDGTENKFKPSVQRVNLSTGIIETIVRGMSRCDGIRTTPWGTVLATEETGDGAAYEILDPLTTTNVVVANRGAAGQPALIVQGDSNGVFTGTTDVPTSPDASDLVIKRTALPAMAWEGLFVLSSGIVVGGDELRPGSYEQHFLPDGTRSDDSDGDALLINRDSAGGAIFKFIPSSPRTATTAISDLNDSPLVSGSTYAMQVSCRDSRQQAGQGCEVGNAAWIAVETATARVSANDVGATGYYRPEDLHIDPIYTPGTEAPNAVRFCWTNTGNTGIENHGEVICGVDSEPLTATPLARTVVVNRFVEGDGDFAAPDNIAFQPNTGIVYVIEDRNDGDVWACLRDGADRDNKTDGCVKMLSIAVQGAEPTGFSFSPDGNTAYVSIQHAGGTVLFDGNDTDDLIIIEGFNSAIAASTFGADYEATLHTNSTSLFGFEGPLLESSTVGD